MRRRALPGMSSVRHTLIQTGAPAIVHVLIRRCWWARMQVPVEAVVLLKPRSIHKTTSGKIQRQR